MSLDINIAALHVYQFKVSLRHVDPSIWRRVRLRSDTTIAQLHDVLQILMGWQDVHLHQFRIQGKRYGVGREGGIAFFHDPHQVRLADFRLRASESFVYEYDMGDFWEHDLRLERILPLEPGKTYPVCTDGSGDCPPEDSGGPAGFMERQQERSDPDELDAAKADVLSVAQHILDFYDFNSGEEPQEEPKVATGHERHSENPGAENPGAMVDWSSYFHQDAFLEALERMKDRLRDAPVHFDRRSVNAALRRMSQPE